MVDALQELPKNARRQGRLCYPAALGSAVAGTAADAAGTSGAAALSAGCQVCCSSDSRQRFLSVGRRSKTSLRWAHGSCPLSLAEAIRLGITAARSAACREPTKSQLLRLC